MRGNTNAHFASFGSVACRRSGADLALWLPQSVGSTCMADTEADFALATVDEIPVDPLRALVLEMATWRNGHRRDESLFDRFLPARYRLRFAHFWTPLCVAARVAEWLDELELDSVVDVGSGVGKFCIAAALASRSSFVGLEQRPELLRIAGGIAEALNLESRVTFSLGVLGETPVPSASCYYFFNPFGESLLEYPLDHNVEVSASRTLSDIFAAEQLLREAPGGTHVVTYNGFGGTLPNGYEVLRRASEFRCPLLLARKS
jgi:SAM-dependent methyltransferase